MGPGYRHRGCSGCASTKEVTVRQDLARRPRRLQLPMPRDLVQPPILRDQSRRLLSPVIGASPLPGTPPAWRTAEGSAPQPPPRCLLFLSWVLMAQGNPLGPRPKSTTCRHLCFLRFRSGNLRGTTSSAFGHPTGCCARAQRPRQLAHRHGACVGAPPRKLPSNGRSVFRGPRIFLDGIGPGTLAPNFEKNQ